MDSLALPLCTLVYIVCNPTPRGSPFKLSLGLHSNQSDPIPPSSSESPSVVVHPRFTLGCLIVDGGGCIVGGHVDDIGGEVIVVVVLVVEWWWWWKVEGE